MTLPLPRKLILISPDTFCFQYVIVISLLTFDFILNIISCILLSKPADNTRHCAKEGTYFKHLQK